MPSLPSRPSLWILCVCWLSFVIVDPALTQPKLRCGLVNQPAATVLLPYFEVDMVDTEGKNTLFSVSNSGLDVALAHAVVWTNWGHPLLSFDFFLDPRSLLSFNLRSILAGQFPESRPPSTLPAARYQSCATPVTLPIIDPERIHEILSGNADPFDGLCYSESVSGGSIATGYITIDAVHDCSANNLVTPLDPEYFGDCATGLATNDNVLSGDFFLIEPNSDFAQGERLVALIADQERFGDPDVCVDPPCSASRITDSFYDAESNRMPLPRTYEARFLNGGAFSGGTEVILWAHGTRSRSTCSSELKDTLQVHTEVRTEAGIETGSVVMTDVARVFRMGVGTDSFPVASNFGSMRLKAWDPNDGHDQQLWMMPVLSAEARYSVGTSAVPVEDFCAVD